MTNYDSSFNQINILFPTKDILKTLWEKVISQCCKETNFELQKREISAELPFLLLGGTRSTI